MASFEISAVNSGELLAPAGIRFGIGNFLGFPVNVTPDPVTTYNDVLHDVTWVWSFDDAANAAPTTDLNIPDAWKNLNTAYGYKAFHVFTDPGTYDVTCTGYHNGVQIAQAATQIVVADPDTVYAGTKTICVSTGNDFSGAPAGSGQYTSLASAITAYKALGAPGRLLLRAGETYANFSEGVTSAYPNFRLGAFGTGAKPVIRVANPAYNEGSKIGLNFSGTTAPGGPTIYGIRFEGGWDADYEVGRNRKFPFSVGFYETPGWFLTFHRCEFDGFDMLPASPFFDRGDAYTFNLNDCLVTNWRDYGIFMQVAPGPGAANIVGTALRQSPGAMRGGASNGVKTGMGNDHGPFRNETTAEAIFSVVETFSCVSWAGEAPQPGLRHGSNGGDNFQTVIDRHCHEGGSAFTSQVVPTKDDELAGNLVIDKVLAIGVAPKDTGFNIATGGSTVRNALFYFPDVPYDSYGGSSAQMFVSDRLSSGAGNLDAPVKIYNNTMLALQDETLNYSFSTIGGFTDLTIENNLSHAPNQPSALTADAPVDTSTAIAGVTPKYPGKRNSVPKPGTTTSGAVSGSGGTLTFSYPSGYSASDYNTSSPRHVIKVGGSWWFYAEDGDISVSFGGTNITVTNTSGVSWPGATSCVLGAELTSTARETLLNASYANPAAVPTGRPLAGSGAIGGAAGEYRTKDDLLTAPRQTPASRGALGAP